MQMLERLPIVLVEEGTPVTMVPLAKRVHGIPIEGRELSIYVTQTELSRLRAMVAMIVDVLGPEA